MSSWSGHQSRFLGPCLPPVNGHLPALSSVFASMFLLRSPGIIAQYIWGEFECAAPSGQIGFAYDSDKKILSVERCAQKLADLQHGRLRLLFLRHVPTLVDDAEACFRHLLAELEADLDRHDAIVVAP